MGRKPGPKIYMPKPTAPTTFQSVVPLESYQQLGAQLRRIQQETENLREQRYQEVGTPAEIGARMAGRRIKEEEIYRASLPPNLQAQLSNENTALALQEFSEALGRRDEQPAAINTDVPSWATSTIKAGMPKTAEELAAEEKKKKKK